MQQVGIEEGQFPQGLTLAPPSATKPMA
jgi:hypothetical protein